MHDIPECPRRQLGKPWQNAVDESFNGTFRDQHLSLQWFRNRIEAKVSIEEWRRHYNELRPHSSLGYLTPAAFKAENLPESDGEALAGDAGSRCMKNEGLATGPVSAILQ